MFLLCCENKDEFKVKEEPLSFVKMNLAPFAPMCRVFDASIYGAPDLAYRNDFRNWRLVEDVSYTY